MGWSSPESEQGLLRAIGCEPAADAKRPFQLEVLSRGKVNRFVILRHPGDEPRMIMGDVATYASHAELLAAVGEDPRPDPRQDRSGGFVFLRGNEAFIGGESTTYGAYQIEGVAGAIPRLIEALGVSHVHVSSPGEVPCDLATRLGVE